MYINATMGLPQQPQQSSFQNKAQVNGKSYSILTSNDTENLNQSVLSTVIHHQQK